MIVCPLRLAAPAALAALLVALGCGSDDSEPASGGASGDGGEGGGGDDGAGSDGAGGGDSSPPSSSACTVPEDCIAVSATCCECPTFAVSAGSEVASACEQVDCDPPDGCPLVEPACVEFQCQLVCTPVATGQVCANGFDRDSFGCLVDTCRAPPGEVYACELDDDCVEAPADCCGCELGGAETAVAASALDGYLESLGCSGDPACPGVDVCDAELVPRCIAQACTLGPAGGGSPDDGGDGGDGNGGDGSLPGGNLCGVPDFPPCPVGQACILNLPDGDDASRMGVGTCADL